MMCKYCIGENVTWEDEAKKQRHLVENTAMRDSKGATYGTMNLDELSGTQMLFRHADPAHDPALNPQSAPGYILVTDNAIFANVSGTMGLSNALAVQ